MKNELIGGVVGFCVALTAWGCGPKIAADVPPRDVVQERAQPDGAVRQEAAPLQLALDEERTGRPWPHVEAPQGESDIRLASLSLDVQISGAYARTRQTLVFYNPNARVLEGSLTIPMPSGATVTGYALDLEGKLVDGVVVEKKRARQIMDTEVRRGVDPGLVEQTRGNAFRTRIYPIPAKGSRTVRLETVAPLLRRAKAASFQYTPPLGQKLEHFTMKLQVLRSKQQPRLSHAFAGLGHMRFRGAWVGEWEQRDVQLDEPLIVQVPDPETRDLISAARDATGEGFFSAQVYVGEGPGKHTPNAASPTRGRLGIAWDASGSHSTEAAATELLQIARLAALWGDREVLVRSFSEAGAEDSAHQVLNGDAAALLSYLRALPRDGGTKFEALDLRAGKVPVATWLLVSDGMRNLQRGLPRLGAIPVHVLTASPLRDEAALRRIALETGGSYSDANTVDIATLAQRVSGQESRLRRVDVSAGDATDLHWSPELNGGYAAVVGRLNSAATLSFQISDARGASRTETRRVKLDAGADGALLASAWAARRVDALSALPELNQAELLRLGRRFGIASPASSLLVLETLEQHVEHDVRPAPSRPEMLQAWLAARRDAALANKQVTKNQVDHVAQLFAERREWWSKRQNTGYRLQESKKSKAAARLGGSHRSASPARSAVWADEGYGYSFSGDGLAAVGFGSGGASAKPGALAPSGMSMTVQEWTPDTPYLRALQGAPRAARYAEYLKLRAAYLTSPSFFLDCASFFFKEGQASRAKRILSNLGELELEDASLLRIWAYRLREAGELDDAVEVLRTVLSQRPEEAQSHRDLALTLIERFEKTKSLKDAQEAVDELWHVIRVPDPRFAGIGDIAAVELNRFLYRVERQKLASGLNLKQIDERLKIRLDFGLRVVMSWDADMTDLDLHVQEPSGEDASYSNPRSQIGGHVTQDYTQGYGPEEYTLRDAPRGKYQVVTHYFGSSQQKLTGPATLTATIFLNYGRPNETRRVVTRRVSKPDERVDLAEFIVGGNTMQVAAQ